MWEWQGIPPGPNASKTIPQQRIPTAFITVGSRPGAILQIPLVQTGHPVRASGYVATPVIYRAYEMMLKKHGTISLSDVWENPFVQHESDRHLKIWNPNDFSPDTVALLKHKGHRVEQMPSYGIVKGYVNGILKLGGTFYPGGTCRGEGGGGGILTDDMAMCVDVFSFEDPPYGKSLIMLTGYPDNS